MIDCRVDSPIAVAMNAVLHTKYAVAAPTRGLGTIHIESSAPGGKPPNAPNTSPAAFTVNTSDAMLYSVRYGRILPALRHLHPAPTPSPAPAMPAAPPRRRTDTNDTPPGAGLQRPPLAIAIG